MASHPCAELCADGNKLGLGVAGTGTAWHSVAPDPRCVSPCTARDQCAGTNVTSTHAQCSYLRIRNTLTLFLPTDWPHVLRHRVSDKRYEPVDLIVKEWKTNLMSLAILFYFLCTQHVSNINTSIIRSLQLCCWITTSVVLFSVRCVLEIWCYWVWVVPVLQAEACFSLQHGHYSKPVAPNLQHTTNWEQNDRCGNSTTQSQAPDDGYSNVRNMFST